MLTADVAKLLDIFVNVLGKRPGDAFSNLELARYFEAAGGKREDCFSAIPYAIENGWIKSGDIGHVVLTEAGAQAVSPSHPKQAKNWVR